VFFSATTLAAEVFGPTVVVEGHDVGFAKLNCWISGRFAPSGEVSTQQTPLVIGCVGLASRARRTLGQKGDYAGGFVL